MKFYTSSRWLHKEWNLEPSRSTTSPSEPRKPGGKWITGHPNGTNFQETSKECCCVPRRGPLVVCPYHLLDYYRSFNSTAAVEFATVLFWGCL